MKKNFNKRKGIKIKIYKYFIKLFFKIFYAPKNHLNFYNAKLNFLKKTFLFKKN